MKKIAILALFTFALAVTSCDFNQKNTAGSTSSDSTTVVIDSVSIDSTSVDSTDVTK